MLSYLLISTTNICLVFFFQFGWTIDQQRFKNQNEKNIKQVVIYLRYAINVYIILSCIFPTTSFWCIVQWKLYFSNANDMKICSTRTFAVDISPHCKAQASQFQLQFKESNLNISCIFSLFFFGCCCWISKWNFQ